MVLGRDRSRSSDALASSWIWSARSASRIC